MFILCYCDILVHAASKLCLKMAKGDDEEDIAGLPDDPVLKPSRGKLSHFI